LAADTKAPDGIVVNIELRHLGGIQIASGFDGLARG
jgi:hypothetical protein